MKAQFLAVVLVILAGLALSSGSACKKASGPAVGAATAYQLPGATNALAALRQKNYEETLAELAKARESASNEKLQTEYMSLVREVRSQLLENSTTDPKAAAALDVLRRMTAGR